MKLLRINKYINIYIYKQIHNNRSVSDILDFVIILLFLPVGRLFSLPLDEIRFQIRLHNGAEEIYEANK